MEYLDFFDDLDEPYLEGFFVGAREGSLVLSSGSSGSSEMGFVEGFTDGFADK